MRNYQICSNCVMDTSDSTIIFNEEGVCNHCINYKQKSKTAFFFSQDEKERILFSLIEKIKKMGEIKNLIV